MQHEHLAVVNIFTCLLKEIVAVVGVAGSDLVNWLQTHVEGFTERRDARRYAAELLRNGYIRHTVNKTSFSEQCYYTIAEICAGRNVFLTLSISCLHLDTESTCTANGVSCC